MISRTMIVSALRPSTSGSSSPQRLGDRLLPVRFWDDLERHRDRHLDRQVRIVEAVGVNQQLAGNELLVGAAEGVALACREVAEGHPVPAADTGFEFVHGAEDPKGGSQLATASGSTKARKTFSVRR